MLVIGESGTGKSTLCNVLAGEKHDSNIFPASPYASGRTHCTSIHTDAFFAGDNLKPFTIIDTQGFNDPGKVGSQESQKNNEIIHELLMKLFEITHVNLFVICLNGMNVRVHESLKYMITMFRDIFGQKMEGNLVVKDENVFWKRCVVVYTHMSMDITSVKRRVNAQGGLSDEDIILNNILELKRIVGIGEQIKLEYATIDALYEDSNPSERKEFKDGCLKLYKFLSEKSPAMTVAMIKAHHEKWKCKLHISLIYIAIYIKFNFIKI